MITEVPTTPGTVLVWRAPGERVERKGYVSRLFGIYRRGDGRWLGIHLLTGRGCGVNMRTLSGARERLLRILDRTGIEVWDTDFGFTDEDAVAPATEEGRQRLRDLAAHISHPDTYVGGNR